MIHNMKNPHTLHIYYKDNVKNDNQSILSN